MSEQNLKVDLLVAEIGSTTTLLNAFTGLNLENGEKPRFLAQASSHTTVDKSDVTIGLENARKALAKKFGKDKIETKNTFASSSAAGGLSMTVHGLVRDMTVRAAREAALGSGAVLRMVTAGRLRASDLKRIKDIDPRVIMVAGGVDYGERDTALDNFSLLAAEVKDTPILYAGNCENQSDIKYLADKFSVPIYISENVYPEIDQLNIEPAREIIQDIFEEHIVEAPGMADIHQEISGKIMPTPGAVMAFAKTLYEELGDLLVIDVGGATTDVHSVTPGSEALQKVSVAPEPLAKRTVEGDLGVFRNRHYVYDAMSDKMKMRFDNPEETLNNMKEKPESKEEWKILQALTETCVNLALERHAGRIYESFSSQGRKKLIKGKDLTQVKTIILTGGALTHLPQAEEILRRILKLNAGDKLYPDPDVSVIIDKEYIMASLGVMSTHYPEAARRIFLDSVK